MLEAMMQAIPLIATIEVLIIMLVGIPMGLMLGAIPGVGGMIGVGVLLPLTFGMSPVPAMVLLIAIYKGALLGGSFSAILINTPGEAAAAATCFDGYPLSKKGYSKKALQASIFSSAFADLISDIVLIIGSFALALVAIRFGPSQIFWIIVFSLLMTGCLTGPNLWKGLLSIVLGLFLGTIGLDPLLGTPRFGVIPVLGRLEGLELVAVLLGAFALSEILLNVEKTKKGETAKQLEVRRSLGPSLSLSEIRESLKAFFIGTVYGTITGIIPGIGTSAAAFLSYALARQAYGGKSKGVKFGEGAIPGVVAPEAGNNAVSGANLIPLLTLGIPGSAIAALLLGALVLQGITPGPLIFINHGPVVYAIFILMIIANILNLIYGHLLIKPITKLLKGNPSIIFPVVVLISFTGVYSINNRLIDLGVLIAVGILSYFLRKGGVPVAPMVIAFILTKMLERNFRLSLSLSGGEFSIFTASPINQVLIGLCVIGLALVIVQRFKEKKLLG